MELWRHGAGGMGLGDMGLGDMGLGDMGHEAIRSVGDAVAWRRGRRRGRDGDGAIRLPSCWRDAGCGRMDGFDTENGG
jgi:hypothetical protein